MRKFLITNLAILSYMYLNNNIIVMGNTFHMIGCKMKGARQIYESIILIRCRIRHDGAPHTTISICSYPNIK